MKGSVFLLAAIAAIGDVCRCAGGENDSSVNGSGLSVAETKVCLRILDESGCPLSNATITATISDRVSDYSVQGLSDANGGFVVSGCTTGDYLQFLATKDGFYDSWARISYIAAGSRHKMENGRWRPYGGEQVLRLRRVINPACKGIGRGSFALTKNLNCWLGFDLQKHDYVHPFGAGSTADFEVMIRWNGKWLPDYSGMGVSIRFSNPYSGYYEMPINHVSKFKGPYSADASKNYAREAEFSEKVVGPAKRIRRQFDENKCWVVRSRCKVDENGNLETACYSVVHKVNFCAKSDGRGGFRVVGAYNPKPNDANLEY